MDSKPELQDNWTIVARLRYFRTARSSENLEKPHATKITELFIRVDARMTRF